MFSAIIKDKACIVDTGFTAELVTNILLSMITKFLSHEFDQTY